MRYTTAAIRRRVPRVQRRMARAERPVMRPEVTQGSPLLFFRSGVRI